MVVAETYCNNTKKFRSVVRTYTGQLFECSPQSRYIQFIPNHILIRLENALILSPFTGRKNVANLYIIWYRFAFKKTFSTRSPPRRYTARAENTMYYYYYMYTCKNKFPLVYQNQFRQIHLPDVASRGNGGWFGRRTFWKVRIVSCLSAQPLATDFTPINHYFITSV